MAAHGDARAAPADRARAPSSWPAARRAASARAVSTVFIGALAYHTTAGRQGCRPGGCRVVPAGLRPAAWERWPSDAAVRVAACALAALAVVIAAAVSVGASTSSAIPGPASACMPDGGVAPLALSPARVRDQAHALRFDDRIVAVDGVPVAGAADVRAAVERVGARHAAPLHRRARRAAPRVRPSTPSPSRPATTSSSSCHSCWAVSSGWRWASCRC